MIVFGDLATRESARTALASVFARFRAAMGERAGLDRHAALVAAYIEASRIAQGCVDAEFAQAQADSLTPLHIASVAALRALARVVAVSWRSAFAETETLDARPLENLLARAPRDPVEARVAEGFAFYALYPEACFAPGANADGETVVTGVRSIGMALAPLLAEAVNASLCVTLRPSGHPFARVCTLAPDLRDALHARRHACFRIIDEGPGLSGSSFLAVADALETLGVARDRIEFVASNPAGPGGAASRASRERWSATRRRILDCAPAIGRALAGRRVVRDMSGGLWRDGHANAAAPANRPSERRKLLVESADGTWLAKFAGLGAIGEDKARLARALAEAGFTPQTGDARHGFVPQRWIANARAIESAPRAKQIAHIADYLAFRAKALPALKSGGASVERLFEMARYNCARGVAEDAAAALDRFVPTLERLARMERPVATDNRMHAWEWLCSEEGAILKCDAADHCAGHDLVGCRDAAWDAAGAVIEFALGANERARLLAGLDAHGVEIAPPLLDFFLVAYCAFQLGAATMAANANANWPDDAQRWSAQRARYAAALRNLALSPARFR